MKQNPDWRGPMWQCRGQRKQCTRPFASGSHHRASYSSCVFWRIFSSSMDPPPCNDYTRARCAGGVVKRGRAADSKAASGVAAALEAASFRGPVYKPLHVFAVFPGQLKKFARGQVVRFFSKKRLKPPPHIRTIPWFQPIAPGRIPVVAQCLKHCLAPRANRPALSAPNSREAVRKDDRSRTSGSYTATRADAPFHF